MTNLTPPLRLGIIGLGPLWHGGWRRAALGSRRRFTIYAVCDAVHDVAEREARRLRCQAAEGPTHLLQMPDLDAVLLVDAAWHGLWPLEQAIQHQKPVLSVPMLDADPEHAEGIAAIVKSAEARVMFALPWRHTPATIRLRRLLHHRLGAIKLISCRRLVTRMAGHLDAIDWCLHLLQSEPIHVQAAASHACSRLPVKSLLLDFAGGAVAQLTTIAGAAQALFHAEIHAEHGTVQVRQPNRLTWRHGRVISSEGLRSERSVEERLLHRFHRFVNGARREMSEIEFLQAAYRLL